MKSAKRKPEESHAGRVLLDLSAEEHQTLCVMLGYALGSLRAKEEKVPKEFKALLERIVRK